MTTTAELAATETRGAAPPPGSGDDLRAAWRRAYEPVTRECDEALAVLEGAVPRGLEGVLFRNGPGRLGVGRDRYAHLFDGDGMVTRFAFGPGGVRYRNRYVRTREFLEEERAGRMLYRAFGTNLPGGWCRNALRMRFKNAANTSVVFHGGSLLALWEGGLPHRLDPVTLETLGRHDFDGGLRPKPSGSTADPAGELPFSAHPRVDPASGDLFNFGTVSGRRHRLMLYRVDRRGRLAAAEEVTLRQPTFAHDFVLTPRWRVFFVCPVAFGIARTLLGLAAPADTLRALPGRGTEVLMVPRDGGAPVRLAADPCFVFHFVNAYEDARGRVVVDAVTYPEYPRLSPPDAPSPPPGRPGEPPRLTRFALDPAAGTVSAERLSELPAELPHARPDRAGLPYRYAWSSASHLATGVASFTGVAKFDLESRSEVLREFYPALAGEPVFVPRPGSTREDDGWVIVMLYVPGAHRSELAVLDAGDLSTACRLALPHHVPPGFHGTWVGAGEAPWAAGGGA